MPKFDPFNSSIINPEQQSAFQDKFVDDGKAEEGASYNTQNRNVTSAPTVSTERSNRFKSRFSSNSSSTNTNSNTTVNASSNNEVAKDDSDSVESITNKNIKPHISNLQSSSDKPTTRFALRNKNKEIVDLNNTDKVVEAIEKTTKEVSQDVVSQQVEKDSQVDIINSASTSQLETTKLTGRARFSVNRNKSEVVIATKVIKQEELTFSNEHLVSEEKVEKETVVVDFNKSFAQKQLHQTSVSVETTKSTSRFALKNKHKTTDNTVEIQATPKQASLNLDDESPFGDNPTSNTSKQAEKLEATSESSAKAPWEEDDLPIIGDEPVSEDSNLPTIGDEGQIDEGSIEEMQTTITVAVLEHVEEPKKRFSVKKKSDLKTETTELAQELESKNSDGSLEAATQPNDLLKSKQNESVEKNTHDQLNATEKRAKIENEVEKNATKHHTQAQNEEDVFKLDFDSAVVEANKNNKKGEKMSLEKEEPKKNVKKQYTPEEQEEFQKKKAAFRALAEKVDTIKLKEVFEMVGAHNNEDKIRSKWKMPWGDNVSLKGQQWYNHNGSNGGWGAVSFAKYVYASENHLDLKAEENQYALYKAAVNMLAEYFGEQVDNDEIMAKVEDLKKEEKQGYLPPTKLSDEHLNKVIDYLHQERNIPLWVINKQIEAGKLFAGVPDWVVNRLKRANVSVDNAPDSATYCIFATKYTAECRCIADETFENAVSPKGFASGSEKKLYGFTVVPDRKSETPIVAATEASIDAMSYQALYPDRFVISTGGADNFTLLSKLALETIENGWSFHVAYDNDHAGENDYENLTKFLIQELGEEKVNELISTGFYVRDVPEKEKDWNKFLQDHVTIEQLDNIYANYVEEGKKAKKVKKTAATVA